MKVLTVLGSPRLQGNTAKLLDIFEEGLAAAGHALERVNVQPLKIAGCSECMACQRPGAKPGCAIRDDMSPLLASIAGCDALVLATPVFMWSYTAQAKAFLDRLFCLSTPERMGLSGKKSALILSGGGDAFDGADLVAAGFMKLALYAGMEHKGQVCAAPMEEGVVEPHVRAQLAALAKAL